MPRLTTESKEEIIKLIKDNYKTRIIAERFGVTQQAITQIKNNYLKYGNDSLIVQKVGRKLLADKTPEQLVILSMNT
ncbi:helix-turn-helix domain-containing protein [Spiroplasma endosymbiont of Nebria brevicollis]|uniref:helix-turn-helix domain-containing protein n=1 Tax=Spiroplasma endosymbiont of Nebria brevicollis TaxID=3066284 RepID=UPI00313B4924